MDDAGSVVVEGPRGRGVEETGSGRERERDGDLPSGSGSRRASQSVLIDTLEANTITGESRSTASRITPSVERQVER